MLLLGLMKPPLDSREQQFSPWDSFPAQSVPAPAYRIWFNIRFIRLGQV
jgi:hypothetical protein